MMLAQISVLHAEPLLFAKSQTTWRICIAETNAPTLLYAVEELTNALKKISGAAFPVQAGGEVPNQAAIVIGDLTHPLVKQNMQALKLTPGAVEQVAVKTLGGRLFLAGNQPRGALYAVYTFLNQELGVRWLWPGKSGEFMPARAQYSLPNIDRHHTPGYQYRGFHICGAWRDRDQFLIWMGRNFVNMHRHVGKLEEQRLGFHSIFSDHNAHLKPSEYFAEHPEYFAEIEGKRYPEMICLTHPEVLKLVAEKLIRYVHQHPELEILSIFPADRNGDCRCQECAKMSVSTAWFSFYNKLTDILKAEFPHLKFATLAYMGYLDVPACEIRNTEFVEYATYGRCNAHPFSDTNCTRNAKVLKGFDEWEKAGVPLGNYGYEFDIFRNSKFTPFYTMIEDAIREGHRRQQAALITEVVLSPATGPITSVWNVQNRLPIYLYAQFMWNPELTTDDLLADWCQTAYGDAAEPMLAYLRAMGEAWTAMNRHPGILGNAVMVVDAFMTEKLRAQVQEAFEAASTALAKQTPSAMRDHAVKAFVREGILYKQWQDLADQKSGKVPTVDAPLLDTADDFDAEVSRSVQFPKDDAEIKTSVQAAWTKEALLLRWRCDEPQPEQLRAAAVARDQGVTDDDAVEIEIASGLTGENYFLAVNTKGVQADALRSTVGVMDALWNPEWQSQVTIGDRHWDVQMKIPFASLGKTPQSKDTWQIQFRRTSGGRAGRTPSVFPETMAAMLYFSPSPVTGRQLLYWSGNYEADKHRDPMRQQSFKQAGWDMRLCKTKETLLALHPIADAYWFRYPEGVSSSVPAEYWHALLLPAVSNGAVAFFPTYVPIPLERYFNDPSFKVSVSGVGSLPLVGHITTYLAPGEWGLKPYNIAERLKRKYSPFYVFHPADPQAWTVLAMCNSAPGEEPAPYLLVRRYGKGLVVRGGDALAAQPAEIIENLLQWNTRMREKLPDGELEL